jgi:hypothetical protein
MATAKGKGGGGGEPRYRLVVFDEVDEPVPVRDLFCKVTGMHPTEAMLWVSKVPGTWPHPLPENQTRALLDGLYDLAVAAEAWLMETFPELGPARTIHDAACLPEGFRVKGLRGEPTHWVPWNKVELICAGRVEAEDEFRSVSPMTWPSAVATGLRALTFRKPRPHARAARAMRIPRDAVGEVLIVRTDPRITFRVVEGQMNYAYLGDRLNTSAAVNFPLFVADLCARADSAFITPSTRAVLRKGKEPAEREDEVDASTFPTPQSLLDYATHRLLWSWYQRDREKQLRGDYDDDDATLEGD